MPVSLLKSFFEIRQVSTKSWVSHHIRCVLYLLPSLSSRIQTLKFLNFLHRWDSALLTDISLQSFYLCPRNAHSLTPVHIQPSWGKRAPGYRLSGKSSHSTQSSMRSRAHPSKPQGLLQALQTKGTQGSPAGSLDASFFDLLFELNP